MTLTPSPASTERTSVPSRYRISPVRSVPAYVFRTSPVLASSSQTGARYPSVTYTRPPAATSRFWMFSGMSPGRVLNHEPFHSRHPHRRIGTFQSKTPLNASRATRNHLSGNGCCPARLIGASSTIANRRPRAVTSVLTLESVSCDRSHVGPAVHW